MNFIFCKLTKRQKTWISFFCKLKNLKKHEFHFLQAYKTSKNMNFIFCKLKKLKKHEFHLNALRRNLRRKLLIEWRRSVRDVRRHSHPNRLIGRFPHEWAQNTPQGKQWATALTHVRKNRWTNILPQSTFIQKIRRKFSFHQSGWNIGMISKPTAIKKSVLDLFEINKVGVP